MPLIAVVISGQAVLFAKSVILEPRPEAYARPARIAAFLGANALIWCAGEPDGLRMMRNQTTNFGGIAAQFVLGSAALAVVTLAFFWFQVDLAATAFTYLIVILLFSLMGSFTASALLSIVAVAGLAYFFVPPILHFRIDPPHHVVALVAFFLTSLIVTRLIGSARKEKETALEAEAKLLRSEADLRDSEREWREVFEHNPVMYFMVDAAGTVLNVNSFGAAQLGYSVAEMVGDSVLKVFFEEDRELVRQCVALCLETVGQSHTWEIRKVRKNGSMLWVRENAKALRRADNQLVILIACEDITERMQAENALRQSEAYLAQAQELSRTGSFGWSVATGEIIWSRETFRIFERDQGTNPTLQFVLQRTHPEDRAKVQKTIDQASSDGKDFEHEYRLLMPDGSVKHVHARARARRDASGRIEFVGAVTDITAAREAEQKLRRSEAYLAEAQHLSHTGSWSWDVRRRDFVYRSAEVYRLFGFDPNDDAVSAQAIQARIPQEDLQQLGEVVRQAVREKRGQLEFDFRIVLPDGATRRVHSVAHPVLGSDGEVSEIIGTHMDVTEQHTAREKLEKAFHEIKKSEDRLRLVINTIPALVWRNRPDGPAEFFNLPYLDYTGLSLDQALEWGWTRAVHPEDVEALLATWRTTWPSGKPCEAEARLRRFDGEYRWFLFRTQPLRDDGGRIVQWYGSATDIEDRKRTEVALRESEQRFRDYAEIASDWLWETGVDHEVTHLSEHTSAAGVAASALIGLPRWQVATDVDAEPEKWRQHRVTLDAHLPFRDLVYPTVNRMGSPIYVRTSGKPVFDAGGKFLGYRGVSTDITATIRADQAEQALRKAQAELAHVTRVTTLGELTASISHEINQPLAAIVANADACLAWLDRETPDLGAARQSVEWIIDDGIRAGEVIRRVRALAKKTDIERSPLDINDVASAVVALVQRELLSHEVSVRVELAPALPMVLGDRVQLQQVIINLVMNSIEAMQPVRDRPRELVIQSGQDEMGRVFLTVTDSGVGISTEDAERMFDPFFTTKTSGLGMGLSICRSIVEAHDGRLAVVCSQGPGARFQFVLPSHQEAVS
jgi:PAS domain S-box-containing protein